MSAQHPAHTVQSRTLARRLGGALVDAGVAGASVRTTSKDGQERLDRPVIAVELDLVDALRLAEMLEDHPWPAT